MEYKFVDIGCSFFGTSVDEYGLNVNGLLVEPYSNAFDLLPSSNTVKKIQVAISDKRGIMDMWVPVVSQLPDRYYTHQEMVNLKQQNQSLCDSYCNYGSVSLYDKHYCIDAHNVPKQMERCDAITFYDLCNQFQIEKIDKLKIDTEGHDHIILRQVIDLIKEGKLTINHTIAFEYNVLSNKPMLDEMVDELELLGFRCEYVVEHWNADMVMTRLGIDAEKDIVYNTTDLKRRIRHVVGLYKSLLGRDGDRDVLGFVSSPLTLEEIEQEFLRSDEYKQRHSMGCVENN